MFNHTKRVGAITKTIIIMKKQKLNLDSLKVSSFVTGMDENRKETAKGGGSAVYTVCCFDADTNGCTLYLRCDTPQITNRMESCTLPGG